MKRALLGAVLISAACCGPKGPKKPSTQPTVEEVIQKTADARAAMSSFTAEATMDYWLSGQRAKGDVLVMGKTGKMVRFAALSPAGGSTIAEMACDGANYVYVDYQNNCALTGPCNAQSVAMFFGLPLEPDDFLHLALGTPPIIGGNPTGTVTWDSDRGAWKVELSSSEGKQKLSIDAREGRWDVLDTELVGTDNKVRWSVINKDFRTVEGSAERRVPGKTQFKSPAQSQDLLVEWKEMQANVNPESEKFKIEVPSGLKSCK
jgi:hypothetical protein